MQAPSNALFATSVGRAVILPPEIVALILADMTWHDRTILAVTSKAWWLVAATDLWRHVDRVDKLVGLVSSSEHQGTWVDRGKIWPKYNVVSTLNKHSVASVKLFCA